MVSSGDSAPSFALPAVVDGEVQTVALEDYLGEDIVVLAFYPGDFNPACSDGSTGLDDLDLFTMQKDVSILGISADSVHSHRAFAEEYDLHIPLLSDVRGEVAETYGVTVADPDAGYLTRRSVVVIDPSGEVEYVWQADDPRRLPDVDGIRSAVDGIGGADTARARYRVGHAHYREGRRSFTSAMHAFEEREWMLSQNDFSKATEEFAAAQDHFNTAVRFAEDGPALTYYERAEDKAEALWQASEWLAEAASAYASGEGAEGERLRQDAESPLETARSIHEPPDPDDFPPEEDPAADDRSEPSFLPEEDEDDASLDVDIDAETAGDDGDRDPVPDPDGATDGEHGSDDPAEAVSADGHSAADDGDGQEADDGSDTEAGADGDEEIDDAELEEIAAELEEQTEAAQQHSDDESGESIVPDDIDDGEFDLADPTQDGDRDGERSDPEDEEADPGGADGDLRERDADRGEEDEGETP